MQVFRKVKHGYILRHSGLYRNYCGNQEIKPKLQNVNILGIETSCDDTGAAIVNETGSVLGEGYYSQASLSVKLGGVIPSVSMKYHELNITKAVTDAFNESGLSPDQLTAIAVTVKPGNIGTLRLGLNFAQDFATKHSLPLIPIHHMEAHALTARMQDKIDFPFVVLLVSGGHCVLALAESIDKWSIVGQSIDLSPGNLLDHLARRMKLKNLPDMSEICGGRAIEMLAEKGDSRKYGIPSPMSHYRDANYSFSPFHSSVTTLINKLEKENEIEGGRVLEEVNDLCASLQFGVVKHLIRQTHKGLQFLEMSERIPAENKTLVISGGVASNLYLRNAFNKLCENGGYRLVVPPPKLCTDNGVMVAWNGVERWLTRKGILYKEEEMKAITVENKCPLGPDISSVHREMNLHNPKWIKF